MEFNIPKEEKSIIKVIGVGGGGSNAVSYMYRQGIVGVDFAVCNTDNQSLEMSPVPTKIQLGPDLTEGRGAGSKPDVGRLACIESLEDVRRFLEDNTKMLFVTAGMGGGTGTGAGPIIAGLAKEMGILTVGIVTLPFVFEGRRRGNFALEGMAEMEASVDALIVISNDKLKDIHGNLVLSEAFSKADNILTTAAKGIAEIITIPGYVNVDFEDVNTVMRDSGVAIMGTAVAEGKNRAMEAVQAAISSPLLEDNNVEGAEHILLNITSGTSEVTMEEIFTITEYIQEKAGYGTNLIWGNCVDDRIGDKLSVTLIATGFDHNESNGFKEEVIQKTAQSELNHKRTFEDTTLESTVSQEKIVEDIVHLEAKIVKNDFPEVIVEKEEPFVSQENDHNNGRLLRKRTPGSNLNLAKLSSVPLIVEIENTPAFERRGVVLEEVSHSSSVNDQHKLVIGNSDEIEFRKGNSYLHDNVD